MPDIPLPPPGSPPDPGRRRRYYQPPDENTEEGRRCLKALVKLQAQFTILADRTPKQKNAYVFLSRRGSGFAGNTKYLFLHFLRHHPEVTSHFLTQDRETHRELFQAGLPSIYYPSDSSLDVLAQAGTVVVESISFRNDFYYPLVAKARQIQLWHGVGNKKIGFLLKGNPAIEGRDDTLIQDHCGYDLIVSTSPFYVDEVFKKSMKAKGFADYGYPRTDVLYRPVTADDLVGCDTKAYAEVRAARRRGAKILLFAPTFRDNGVTPITQDVIDLLELFTFLKQHNIHMILKPHVRVPVKAPGLPPWVTLCDSRSDIYPFFPLVDFMLTDYSSIHTEFLLMDRPILFFWADFKSYTSVDRGFQFPVEEFSPGPKCFDAAALYRELADAAAGKDEWGPARRALRDKAFRYQDGKACERIAAHLLGGEYAPGPERP